MMLRQNEYGTWYIHGIPSKYLRPHMGLVRPQQGYPDKPSAFRAFGRLIDEIHEIEHTGNPHNKRYTEVQ